MDHDAKRIFYINTTQPCAHRVREEGREIVSPWYHYVFVELQYWHKSNLLFKKEEPYRRNKEDNANQRQKTQLSLSLYLLTGVH